ncbi:MAG TPA: tetratricopeptide repeat protein [Candidatus Krumholzibacteriaceae bacterium]
MKTIIAILVAFVALAVSFPDNASGATPAALLLSCTGDVSVHRSDQTTVKGSYGLQLYAGDEVRTGAGGAAEIHFENGTWIKLGSGSSLDVKAGASKKTEEPVEKGGSFESISNFLKLRDAEGVSTLAALRSGGKHPEIRLESPCQTRVRSDHPVFVWSATDSTVELRLKIYDDRGIRWQRDIRGAHTIQYAADAEPLVPGTTYSWTLETTDPLRFPPLRTQAAFFEVMPADEAKKLENAIKGINRSSIPSESAYRIVLASIYFDYRLLDEAISQTVVALAADPDNGALHAILARLYADTGRSEEAMSEYNRLIEKR